MNRHPKITDYAKLATSTPVNRDAALARDGRGDQRNPGFELRCHEHWETPPPTKPVPANAPNHVGKRVGRLTVIGYLGSHPKRAAKWLVKCVCGRYEARYSKAIANPANAADRCQECAHLVELKRREHWLRTGRHLPRERVA